MTGCETSQAADITGSVLTHRRVWALAGPIILSNISVPLVGAVDTAVVGRLPEADAIGAVALGAMIFSFLYWGFGFLRMSTTGFVARADGAKNLRELGDLLGRTMMMALLLGLLVIVIGWPFIHWVMLIIDSSPSVEQLARDYSHIRLWSAPAVLGMYVISGTLIGLQNTRAAFLLQLLLNLTNVFLDVLFVSVLGAGVEGVAYASVIAEYLTLLVGLWVLSDRLKSMLRSWDWSRLLNREALHGLLSNNANIFIRTLCLLLVFSYFTAQGATQGEIILAANAILLHFFNIMAYDLDGFAHAAEALAGSAYGARSKEGFRRAVRLTTQWAGLVSLFVAVVYWLLGPLIIRGFTNIEPVIVAAQLYLPWVILLPLISVWSFQLDGIFIGAGLAREMRNGMVVSLLLYLGMLQLLIPWLGNHGLFLGLCLFMIVRAFSLYYYYPSIEAKMLSQPVIRGE